MQGAIYNSIDNKLAAFLHDQGFAAGSRNFKLFTFSRLNGPFRIQKENNSITFSDEMKLVISSPYDDFCQSLVNILLTRGFMFFGKSGVPINKVYLKKMEIEGEKVIVKTLSPIVLYSTLLRSDGRKYTCYFQPGDPDYEQLFTENLKKKYLAIYGRKPLGEVNVKSLGTQKLRVINYKNFIVKGYSGKLELQGPQELLQIGLDSGLGSKNSQGFGCVEIVEKVKERG